MTTYYLNADTGVDSGAGGVGAPWKTLVYAIANSVAGDTIYCQNSVATYDFRNTTVTARNIIGQSTNGVIFDGGGAGYTWSRGTGTTNISNIWFKNIIDSIIFWIPYAVGASPNLNLTACRFSDCRAYGVDSWGGIISGYTGVVVHTTVTSCIFDNIDMNGYNYPPLFDMHDVAAGSTFNWNNNVFIIRTAFTYAPYGIFTAWGGGANTTWTFKNSIFRNLQAPVTFLYNLSYATFYNCDIDAGFVGFGGASLVNCITSDPLFVDENNGNFHLRPNSPCRDTGVII